MYGGLDRPSNFVETRVENIIFYAPMQGELFVDGVSGQTSIKVLQEPVIYCASNRCHNNKPEVIQNNFIDNGDGTYGVRFYRDNGQAIWTTVDDQVPTQDRITSFAAGNSCVTDGRNLGGAGKGYARPTNRWLSEKQQNEWPNSYASIEGGQEILLLTSQSRLFYRLNPNNRSQRDHIIELADQGKISHGSQRLHQRHEREITLVPIMPTPLPDMTLTQKHSPS